MKSDLNNSADANKPFPAGCSPGSDQAETGDARPAAFPSLSAYALALRDPELFSKCYGATPRRPH